MTDWYLFGHTSLRLPDRESVREAESPPGLAEGVVALVDLVVEELSERFHGFFDFVPGGDAFRVVSGDFDDAVTAFEFERDAVRSVSTSSTERRIRLYFITGAIRL